MRNRDIIVRKLENIESNINKLNFYLNQPTPAETYRELMEIMRDNISQAKDFLEQETISVTQ